MVVIILVIAGLVVIGAGIYTLMLGKKNKEKFSGSATATISKVEFAFGAVDGKRNQDMSHIDYSPVYDFTADGVEYSEPGKMYSSKKSMYKVGDTTILHYKPEDPRDFYTDKDGLDNSRGIIMIIVGAAVAIAGVLQKLL